MVVKDVLAAAKFVRMPFRIVPPNQMEDIQWAGDRTVINTLLDAARSPHPDALGTSELVILIGTFGSGKTNALKYLAQKLSLEHQLIAYVTTPHVTDKPTWADIVRGLFTRSFLKEDVIRRGTPLRRWFQMEANRRAQAELGPDKEDPDKLQKTARLQRKAIAQEILPDLPGFVEFLIDLCDPEDRATQDRNWNYLTSKITAKEGAQYNQKYTLPPEGIDGDYNGTLILTSFIRLMTYPTNQGKGSDVVYIFIDEAEGLYDLRTESRQSILKGLKDLFNSSTENLCIALAATQSDASELWGLLDQHLMMRLSRQPIQFSQLTTEEAKAFLLDVMAQNRIASYSGPKEWPLSEDGLEAFVVSCPQPMTPRRLLVSMQRVVFQRYKEKVCSGLGIDSTDIAQFSDWMSG